MLEPTKRTLRALMGAPALSLAAVAILAVGIGASIALGVAIERVLLAPMPYPQADRLVAPYTINADGVPRRSSLLDVLDWRAGVSGFESLAAYRRRSFALDRLPAAVETGESADTVDGGGQVEVVQSGLVTADFFAVLGSKQILGRTFDEAEAVAEARVAVIGERLWRRSFAGAATIVGQTIRLNDQSYEVLGVISADTPFEIDGHRLELYLPLSRRDYGHARTVRTLSVIGRLAEGRSTASVGDELALVASRLAAAFPASNSEIGAGLTSLRQALVGHNRRPLGLLGGGALLLLLIACANVANLLTAWVTGRLGTLAIETALGAPRRVVVGQLLVSTLILVVVGSGLGLVLAGLALELLPAVVPAIGGRSGAELDALGLGLLVSDRLPWSIAAFLGLVVVPLVAVAPVLAVRRLDPARLLAGRVAPLDARNRLRSGLVVVQVAISVVLLSMTLLLLRSYTALLGTDPGFRAAGVTTFGLGLPARYESEQSIIDMTRKLSTALEALPSAASVGAMVRRPYSGSGLRTGFGVVDGGKIDGSATINVVSPGTFRTLEMPLSSGRDFTWRDDLAAPRVVVVNEAFRRLYLAAQDSLPSVGLGRAITLSWRSPSHPAGSSWRVIGVVGDTRELDLAQASKPRVYLSLGQFPAEGAIWLLRASSSHPKIVGAAPIQQIIDRIDPGLQRIAVGSLDASLRDSVGGRRTALGVMLTMAIAAMALTSIGLIAVIGYVVLARRQEWAVRVALGARRADVVALVVRYGVRLAAVGCGLGLVIAMVGGRFIASQLYRVSAYDPWTLVSVLVVVLAIAIASALLPALRAARVVPMDAIRS